VEPAAGELPLDPVDMRRPVELGPMRPLSAAESTARASLVGRHADLLASRHDSIGRALDSHSVASWSRHALR